MATYPNNYRTGVGFNPNSSYYGIMSYFCYNAEIGTGAGSRLNWQIGSDGNGFARTASCPDGYGMQTPFPPVKAGSMSAWNDPVVQLDMTGNLLQGGPMEGAATITIDQAGGLSMVVGLSGSAAVVTLTGNSMVLRMTVGLTGSGAFQLTGDNNLALIVPFEGAGTVMTMGPGGTDLRERLSMSGEWTPFTELSPENLARAVWESLLANYQGDGTAGKALAAAGSGGVDYNALANAVWTYLNRTLTANPGVTTAEIVAALEAAVVPVDATKMNGATIVGDGSVANPWRGEGVHP